MASLLEVLYFLFIKHYQIIIIHKKLLSFSSLPLYPPLTLLLLIIKYENISTNTLGRPRRHC